MDQSLHVLTKKSTNISVTTRQPPGVAMSYIKKVNRTRSMRVNPFLPARPHFTPAEKYYIRKATTYVDNAWLFFSQIEDDFRLLHMPMK